MFLDSKIITVSTKYRLVAAFVTIIVAVFAVSQATVLHAEALDSVRAKFPLRVLYIYSADNDPARAADFRQFLSCYFTTVQTSIDRAFTTELTKNIDVIIVDGNIADRVPADFHRPMVLLGADFFPIKIPESRGYKLQNL